MGGNTIQIFYLHKKTKTLVLSVYWQCAQFDSSECRVDVFADTALFPWDSALRSVMRRKKSLLRAYRAEREKSACPSSTDSNYLRAEVERLKIQPLLDFVRKSR